MNMTPKRRNKIITFTLLALFIIAVSVSVYIIGPEGIVDIFGMRNSYLFILFSAVFAAFSTFTSAPFYTSVITLSAAGLNPFLIGLLGGIGITVGDGFLLYFGKKGRSILNPKTKKKVDILSKWLNKRPKWFVPVFAFLYADGFFVCT